MVCDHDYSAKFTELTGKKDIPIKNVMIFGGGLIARFIALSLQEEANIKIIEQDINRARQLADMLPHVLVIHGDGTDVDLLENEGIADMDAFIAVTGDDENNIITTMVAQQANVPRSIAMINKVEYLSIAPKIGLEAVVSKQMLTVNRVQRYIQHQQVADIMGLPGVDAQLIEFIATDGCRITRKPLKNINFPQKAIIGAVMRDDRVIIPHGDTHIRPDDKVVVFTRPSALSGLDHLFCEGRRDKLARYFSNL